MSSDEPTREAALAMSADEFRAVGHELVENLAAFLESVPKRPVTSAPTQPEVRATLGQGGLPDAGAPAAQLLRDATTLLADNSLFNGHPKFMGYITSSPAPLGALGDLLAAVMNPNLGGWGLSPMASEIEAQTVRWIAELLRYPVDAGGVLVSGGNMANFVGFLAARRAAADWDIRADGLRPDRRFVVYCSADTHTWIQKAVDLFGLGTGAVRWIEVDDTYRLNVAKLRAAIASDRASGLRPLLVVGTAGTVGVGAVDPLHALGELCRDEGIWFHVDGAYGAFAAALDDAPADLHALALADSVAVDPHKWLYSPLEAGCALVRDPRVLLDAFSFQPEYYFFGTHENRPINYYELGMQNSRGFRALKVWLGLRAAGRQGCVRMIADDIALARRLYERLAAHSEFEARTCELSITTFRYVPESVTMSAAELDDFNRDLLEELQGGGEFYPSNAVVDGDFLLRACVVNFNTQTGDVDEIPEIVARTARRMLAGAG